MCESDCEELRAHEAFSKACLLDSGSVESPKLD